MRAHVCRCLHYNYGWACGEAAEHGDQLFQHGSWSHFASFVAREGAEGTTECTTSDGLITALGQRFQVATY